MQNQYSKWANTSPQEHFVKSAILDLNLVLSWQQEGLPVHVGTQTEPRVISSRPLRTADLGWTQQQAAETRARLASFEEDWNAPDMEGYDDL